MIAIVQSLVFTLLFLAYVPLLLAAPPSPSVRAEIDALLASLESSGCEFSRNGAWHTAAEARAHLLQKLEYFNVSKTVQDAEQFIDALGSASSTTGRPYVVKCGSEPAVSSKTWLLAQLKFIRSPGRRPPAAAN